MSLNRDISKVRNWQKKQEKDGHTLDCLIWASLTIGMGDLNEKTAKKFLYFYIVVVLYHAGYAHELENRADGAVRGTSSGTGADCYGN